MILCNAMLATPSGWVPAIFQSGLERVTVGREAIDVLACYCTTGAEKVLLLSAAELVFAQRISALFAGFASRGHFDFDLHARIG